MMYPNLVCVLKALGEKHYNAAAAVGMSPTRFSRRANGHLRFSVEERHKIAATLGFPEKWLFQEFVVPESVDETTPAAVAV